jgi:nucleotide-binding universal stress UspA family protein
MERIVVGVDGSEASLDALRWALREGRLRGCAVEVVHAWLAPTLAVRAPLVFDEGFVRQFREDAESLIDDALLRMGPDAAGVAVDRAATEGPAEQVLVAAAADATLLVVGSRGRGGLGELLLGSVSHHCVQHAACPVVVVHAGVAPAGAAAGPASTGRTDA